MTRVSVKTKYDTAAQGVGVAVSVNAGDLKLKASCTDSTFTNSSSLSGLTLGFEKPGFFLVDFDVPKKATRFQFMNSATIAGKQLKTTYIHAQKANATIVDGTFVFDPSNKLSGKYNFSSNRGQVRYSYFHGAGGLTFEPAYDFETNAWNFAVQKAQGEDNFRASYETSKNILGLEWSRTSKTAGSFKVSASLPVDSEMKKPKVIAERTWDIDM